MKAKAILSNLLKKYNIFLVLIILMGIATLLNPRFLSADNMTNVARQLSVTTILAFGATILIIGGMLDLSAGSVLALSGVIAAQTFVNTENLLLALLAGILIGMACNLLNAVMVATFNAPPFIATLAMMTMARGAALLYTNGQNVLQLGRFTTFGQGSLQFSIFRIDVDIPYPILFLLAMFIITWYVLRHTRFGRSVYAIGGNEEAARASGINITRAKYTAYLINGALVGLAGVLFMSRNNAGLPNGAIGFEFHALTAAVIGGTSFSGGIGTAAGTLAGAFIVGFLDNIMNLTGVSAFVQQIVRGAIIALAVIYDIAMKNRKTRRVMGNIDNRAQSVAVVTGGGESDDKKTDE